MAVKVKKTFRERLETTLKTIKSPFFKLGFSTIDMWVSSGNYAINRLFSGRYDRALLFSRNYVLYGESGSGKSLLAAWCAAEAQRRHGALVVWLDVEKATDDEAGKTWLKRAGVNLDELIYTSLAGLEEIKAVISKIAVEYRIALAEAEGDYNKLQPIVFVIDSWGAALPKSQLEHVLKGELVGDQGQKAKQIGDIILSVTHLVGGIPVMAIGIAHVMDNQEKAGRRFKTTGGHKMVYMASGALLLSKQELDAEKLDDPLLKAKYAQMKTGMTAPLQLRKRKVGITCVVEILKSRVSKPFERIEVQIPYETGMDPYSGLLDLMMQEGLVRVASNSWYKYSDPAKEGDDKTVKFQKKDFKKHADLLMTMVAPDISNDAAIAAEEDPEAHIDDEFVESEGDTYEV